MINASRRRVQPELQGETSCAFYFVKHYTQWALVNTRGHVLCETDLQSVCWNHCNSILTPIPFRIQPLNPTLIIYYQYRIALDKRKIIIRCKLQWK